MVNPIMFYGSITGSGQVSVGVDSSNTFLFYCALWLSPLLYLQPTHPSTSFTPNLYATHKDCKISLQSSTSHAAIPSGFPYNLSSSSFLLPSFSGIFGCVPQALSLFPGLPACSKLCRCCHAGWLPLLPAGHGKQFPVLLWGQQRAVRGWDGVRPP